MTLTDCTRILGTLAMQLRTPLDEAQFRAYHQTLCDVPMGLLERAAHVAARTCQFFPRPVELLRLSEQERQTLLAAHPFAPCEACALNPGWREVVRDGVTRVARCDCRAQWIARLESLGVTGTPLLPAVEHEHASE